MFILTSDVVGELVMSLQNLIQVFIEFLCSSKFRINYFIVAYINNNNLV